MLPDFPTRKQPHSFGCLPTCVQAVLFYYEEDVFYDEAAEWCRDLPQGGCFWSDALTGLIGEGYEVQEVTTGEEGRAEALQILRQVVSVDGLPVIAEVEVHRNQAGHAVVIIGVEPVETESKENIVYMDPDRGTNGEIVSAPIDVFFKRWQARDLQAFCILRE